MLSIYAQDHQGSYQKGCHADSKSEYLESGEQAVRIPRPRKVVSHVICLRCLYYTLMHPISWVVQRESLHAETSSLLLFMCMQMSFVNHNMPGSSSYKVGTALVTCCRPRADGEAHRTCLQVAPRLWDSADCQIACVGHDSAPGL